ncbi:MAG: redox-sensing transcriptional repressor Rex, partial [Clostridiales bacterium]|nr:redox-sensing transcriptional repressor Rex [Clostridiales bacterium]
NMIRGIPVRHINYIENFCIDNSPVCAVTCIPSTDMREVTDLLVKVGIKSFWNFSTFDIAMAHPDVLVENVHLTDSLLTLGYLTNTSLKSED